MLAEVEIYQAYIKGKLDKEDIKKTEKSLQLTDKINSNFLKGEIELKNIRIRKDGRYEWRRQINLIKYDIIDKNKKSLEKKVRELLKLTNKTTSTVQSKKTFNEIAWEWWSLYKKDLSSSKNYEYYLKARFDNNIFNQNIDKITFEQLEQFIFAIKEHRVADYCYLIIKGVFKEAIKRQIIKNDTSKFLTKPKNKKVIGEWFNLKEQKLILENLDKSKMKNEILFYLLTGCRRNEAINVKIEDVNFEKHSIFINGTKSKSAKRYVPISINFAENLKLNIDKMFINNKSWYSKTFQQYLKILGIKNKKLHDLRHTFNTNLYYLGVPDKQRQYYMGHSSIIMTNDIYTHLDPNVTKEDILNLYKDLYPNF